MLLLLPLLNVSYAQTPPPQIHENLITDKDYHYSISLPNTWTIEQDNVSTTLRKLKAFSPDKTKIVFVYSIKTNRKINTGKLQAMGTKWFKDIGTKIEEHQYTELTSKKKTELGFIKNLVLNPTEIEELYCTRDGKVFTLVRSYAKGNHGYNVIVRSVGKDFPLALHAAGTFNANPSTKDNLKNLWKRNNENGSWIFHTKRKDETMAEHLVRISKEMVPYILFALYAGVCGFAGMKLRKGIEIKRALKKFKQEEGPGATLPKLYFKMRRKANGIFFGIFFSWTVLSAATYLLLSLKSTLYYAGLSLAMIVAGIFGVVFTVNDKPDLSGCDPADSL